MKQKTYSIYERLITEYRRSPSLFAVRAFILTAAAALVVLQRQFWTPDILFAGLLVLAIVFGQTKAFLIRFIPLVALLLVYDSFRSIADNLNKNVNFTPMIDADRWMFGGTLPTLLLQQMWWYGSVQWYDFYFYFLYTIHFLMPVLLAVLIWRIRDHLYWQFMWALVGLSFAAFITYVIFPAAPPWMASDLGYIDPIRRISSDIWFAMGVTNFSQVYSELSPNPVAAVPSLHSAYPLLFALFLTKLFGIIRTWWVYFYPLSVWVGVVYLGEHYVIDAILGAMYAVIAYGVAAWYFSKKRSPHLGYYLPVRGFLRVVPAKLRR